MTRRLAGVYAAGSTALAVLVIMAASALFGLFAPLQGSVGATEEAVAVDAAPAYASALGDLETMRSAALTDVAAQVAAQRAALQAQAVREVEAQRAALQTQAVSELAAQRAAAEQKLAADIAAARTQVPAAPASTSTTAAVGAATASPAAGTRVATTEVLDEIAKKTAECERKRGEDRIECLREVAKLRARYGL